MNNDQAIKPIKRSGALGWVSVREDQHEHRLGRAAAARARRERARHPDVERMEIIARQDKRAGRQNTEDQRIMFQRKADALAADANRKRKELGVAEAELSATLASLDRFEKP